MSAAAKTISSTDANAYAKLAKLFEASMLFDEGYSSVNEMEETLKLLRPINVKRAEVRHCTARADAAKIAEERAKLMVVIETCRVHGVNNAVELDAEITGLQFYIRTITGAGVKACVG